MSGNAKLDTALMQELLGALNERLQGRGVSASIHIFGGAAIALTLGREGVTPDVDASYSDTALAEEAVRLANERGLPSDWLNSSGAGWLPQQDRSDLVPTTPGLHVSYARPEHLLAMKMLASRRKDAQDLYVLAKELDLIGKDPSTYEAMLRQAYNGENELEDIVGAPGDLFEPEVKSLATRAHEVVEGEHARRLRLGLLKPVQDKPEPESPSLRQRIKQGWNEQQARRRDRKAARPSPPITQPKCGGYTKAGRRCRLDAGHGGNHRSRF